MLNQTFNNLPDIMSANDLLDVLPLSRSGIYQMINSEGFPVIKIGKRKLIPKEALLKWLSDNLSPTYKEFYPDTQDDINQNS